MILSTYTHTNNAGDWNLTATDFFFECGQLKLVKRSGWWMAGVKEPESVAEHSWRASVIAFVLARLEGKDFDEACRLSTSVAFHDLLETRLQDLHNVSKEYLFGKTSEGGGGKARARQLAEEIAGGQTKHLPKSIASEVKELALNEEAIARDADLLECAFQAKEYLEQGFASTQDWIDSVEKALKTKSAKRLLRELKKTQSTAWWEKEFRARKRV